MNHAIPAPAEPKPRPPLFLSSLCHKQLPQQTLSLPSTPQSPGSIEPSLYFLPSSTLRVDGSSVSNSTTPSLSRSSRQIITCSDFILRDTRPSQQRRSLTQLHCSSLTIQQIPRPNPEKEPKSKKSKPHPTAFVANR